VIKELEGNAVRARAWKEKKVDRDLLAPRTASSQIVTSPEACFLSGGDHVLYIHFVRRSVLGMLPRGGKMSTVLLTKF
jgi:hypothetical protein